MRALDSGGLLGEVLDEDGCKCADNVSNHFFGLLSFAMFISYGTGQRGGIHTLLYEAVEQVSIGPPRKLEHRIG